MSDRTFVCAVHPEWITRHGPALTAAGIVFDAVHDGAALNEVLARDWSVDLVVLDLALATRNLSFGWASRDRSCSRLAIRRMPGSHSVPI